MLTQQAVFSGVARNCAAHLPGVLANLDRLATLYAGVRFVFVVSDSDDGTLAMLRDWLASGRREGRAIDLGKLEDRLPRRTERIAVARNAVLDAIRHNGWTGCDHLVVADLDDVMAAPVSTTAFGHAAAWLDAAPTRAGVFASAAPRYYDIWALRHDRWCPSDCWHPIWGRPESEDFEAAKFREVFARQIAIPPRLPPIAVRSAFGGLGLYRLSFALAGRYRGVDTLGRDVSEHVAFNAAIGEAGGQLHIFPALRVAAPQQHLYQPSQFQLRWRLAMVARRAAEYGVPPWRRLLASR
jgi:hypothetical protein